MSVARPFEWFTSQMNFLSPLLGKSAQCVLLVIVDDRQFDVTAVRHDQNGGIPAEFVLLDPDRRLHRAVGPLGGFSYGASTQNAAKGRVVLFVQAELTQ